MDAECRVELRRRKPPKRALAQQKAAEKEVEAWNAKVPVGTEVCLHRDNGARVRTKTTSRASVMCGTAVAWFENVSGAYAIDHAHEIEQAKAS